MRKQQERRHELHAETGPKSRQLRNRFDEAAGSRGPSRGFRERGSEGSPNSRPEKQNRPQRQSDVSVTSAAHPLLRSDRGAPPCLFVRRKDRPAGPVELGACVHGRSADRRFAKETTAAVGFAGNSARPSATFAGARFRSRRPVRCGERVGGAAAGERQRAALAGSPTLRSAGKPLGAAMSTATL